MSRVIKFRAWDESRQCYFTSPNWVEFNVNKDGVLLARNIERGGGYVDLLIEQFTGLLDKKRTREFPKGQDVYISDICKVWFEDGFILAVIAWSEYFPRIELRPIDTEEYGIADLLPRGSRSIEVIGNIHENKDLLR